MTIFALLAAGQGDRFGSKAPKQFLPIKGKPLIYWTLLRVAESKKSVSHVAIALPKGWDWKKLQNRRAVPPGFPFEPLIVSGGATRPQSLKNILRAIPKKWRRNHPALFVHDAARPAWPSSWIPEMLHALNRRPAAAGVIPVLPVRETVKYVNGDIKTVKSREFLRFSQTPQLVRLDDFEKALLKWGNKNYWDEAQVLESAGKKLITHPGHPLNLKITYPQDLKMLEGAWTFKE